MNSNWSYSPETAQWGHDLCDLDLWPWPFAWTSCLSMVITHEHFRMIWWQEHCQKVWQADRQTGRQIDRRTEISVLRAAWSQLKKASININDFWQVGVVMATATAIPRGSIAAKIWGTKASQLYIFFITLRHVHGTFPVGTWRNNNVIITSKRTTSQYRFDVIMTL